jgi:hypothetical protein
VTGPARPEFVLDGPDELGRLRQFRAAHPDVLIGDGGFGTWQAIVRDVNGETVITRYALRELLDRLAVIFPDLPTARRLPRQRSALSCRASTTGRGQRGAPGKPGEPEAKRPVITVLAIGPPWPPVTPPGWPDAAASR